MVALLALTSCATPVTQPAADLDALRARVADLTRQEVEQVRSLVTLAEAADDTGALRRAYARLDLLGSATPDDRLRHAALALSAGALDEARCLLLDLRRLDRADLRPVYLLADAADRAGDRPERDALLANAAGLHPTKKAPHLDAGDFLIRYNLVRYAEREWQRVLAIREGAPAVHDVEAHTRLAGLAREREEHNAAVAHFRAALELAAEERLNVEEGIVDALTVELALSLRDAGRLDEARARRSAVERFYRDRLRQNPADAEALNALGWFYAGLGENLDEGVALLKRALAIRPDRPEFLDTLAELHFRRGEPRRALDLIEKAIAQKPRNLDYYRRQQAKFQRAAEEKDRTP